MAEGIVLSRALAWFFIVVAACPFTAPFSVCDPPQASSSARDSVASVPLGFATSSLAAAPRAREEQLKDDEDQLNHIDVAKISALEQVDAQVAFAAPMTQKRSPDRRPQLTLRL